MKGDLILLVALTKSDVPFSLIKTHLSKQELMQIREKHKFYCPACKQEVSLKLGVRHAWHFAHKRNNSCYEELEGETTYHINGKKILYEWFQNQGYNVQLEPYIKDAKQRPDLLVKTSNKFFAIEFQCAKITPQVFSKRTRTYQKHGYFPIWILGGNQLKRIKGNFFQFNHFHWLFANNISKQKRSIQICAFCPENKLFIKINDLNPISIQRTFASPAFFPLDNYIFPDFFQSISYRFPLPIWIKVKEFWRQPRLRPSRAEQFLRNIYIQKCHHSSLFPAEAGVPTDCYYFIDTPSYIWQSWILELFIFNKKLGDTIHLKLVYRAFQTLVQKGIFHVRHLPLMNSGSEFQAIENYLKFLCSLKILATKDSKFFIKINDIEYPKNNEHAKKCDHKVLMFFSK